MLDLEISTEGGHQWQESLWFTAPWSAAVLDCASTCVEAVVLVSGVGDMWAQNLSVDKQEQDIT